MLQWEHVEQQMRPATGKGSNGSSVNMSGVDNGKGTHHVKCSCFFLMTRTLIWQEYTEKFAQLLVQLTNLMSVWESFSQEALQHEFCNYVYGFASPLGHDCSIIHWKCTMTNHTSNELNPVVSVIGCLFPDLGSAEGSVA